MLAAGKVSHLRCMAIDLQAALAEVGLHVNFAGSFWTSSHGVLEALKGELVVDGVVVPCGRFPKFHSVFVGPGPWHIEIRHRVKQTSTISLCGFEILKLKSRRLKLWKPTVCLCTDWCLQALGLDSLDGRSQISSQARFECGWKAFFARMEVWKASAPAIPSCNSTSGT